MSFYIQIKEYELSEVFHHSEDKDHFEIVKVDSISQKEIPDRTRNNDIEEVIEEERKEEEMRTFETTQNSPQETTTTSVAPETFTTFTNTAHKPLTAPTTSSGSYVSSDAVDRGDKKAILKKIVQKYTSVHHKRNKLKKSMRKIRKCTFGDAHPIFSRHKNVPFFF